MLERLLDLTISLLRNVVIANLGLSFGVVVVVVLILVQLVFHPLQQTGIQTHEEVRRDEDWE